MKLKKIVLAALVTLAAAPAFAWIDGLQQPLGESELVFIAYNDKASFVKDMGITNNAFVAQMNATGTFNMSVLGSEYSRYLAQNGGVTEWAVVSANPIEFGFSPGEINYFGTKNVNQATFGVNNQLFNDGVNALNGFFFNTDNFANNAGIGFDAGIDNAEYTGLSGTIEYAYGYHNLGNAYDTNNFIGVASEWVYLTTSNANASALVVGNVVNPDQFLRVNFDGSNITAMQVPLAPIPEPGTYALLLAGLCAVGFVARRRQQA